ncbi:trehalase [Flavobacterium gawalongense]|uniref:Trehalase n=1 Tax=Flavobacterium gawalongense TaxID=2594432 RepID=A0ABY3CP76_9FLAO|nr:trehalase family glycosidase [Flavobacterium gawalongense]TRX04218.1 trehalase [Flavobacterium gawalongense]TRX09332.1 trehalase [Flavobacterium gawalongense]TRX13199.1 trehalase [Flavobacterium gawalongense]TRX30739.1 trehalase [Flavobacterium gawalongense]
MNFLINIDKVFHELLLQEDTDKDKKITKDDNGPKKFALVDQNTKQEIVIEGTYHLSNLLQELALLKENKVDKGEIDLSRIQENPVERISRKIRDDYWDELTRTIDKKGLEQILKDEKTTNEVPTLYVSAKDKQGVAYFQALEKELQNFKVGILPENFSMEYVDTLNTKPGILALALEQKIYSLQGVPFVVPGGRFNEMYGWDSYFIGVGLIIDNQLDKAMAIAENFKYQIIHYGKILNANRSYYLTRTQPPLYSSLIIEIVKKKVPSLEWLRSHLGTVILEYNTVWMVQGNRLTPTGLNRYKADGVGMPFEVEPGHFDDVLEPYAKKYNLPIREFEKQYLNRTLVDAELDVYFVHDRSLRESGHDTTDRLINTCANLNSVDVNSFLYKYEKDIAYLIKEYFNNNFQVGDVTYTSEEWGQKALFRKEKIDELCWNEESSMYFDYDFVNKRQFPFEAATTFFPLWAGLCSEHQAKKLIEIALPQFIKTGGITGSTKASTDSFSKDAPQRQWDYPFGWAPHQMLLWEGLINYKFFNKAQEMVYRWLWLITKNAVEYNGTIPEKFDLEISSHKVFAEYGNVGTEFDYIAKEGFGWVNASYQYGLQILSDNLKQELNKLTSPDELF